MKDQINSIPASPKPRPPVVLVIMDGWGVNAAEKGNAVKAARTPHIDYYCQNYPLTSLHASGIEVGLPWGEVGNSEVGHQNLGGGKVIYQNLPRVSLSIMDESFFAKPNLLAAFAEARQRKCNLHLMGLVSPGGVHSHQEHLWALLRMAHQQKVKNVFIQAFTDGRDSNPQDSPQFFKELDEKIKEYGVGKVASVSGRYYAMDRNNSWDRTAKAYETIVHGRGEQALNPQLALKQSYEKKVYDEQLKPTVIVDRKGRPVGPVKNGDVVIFFNFRSDRARQLTQAFVLPSFGKFDRDYLDRLFFVTMTRYDEDLPAKVVFKPEYIKGPLARILERNQLRQMHIAETEKYAHVTYFFNGGREEPFGDKEKHAIIPSPEVPTYDQKPEMSAYEVAARVTSEIREKNFDFIVVNFANGDMVGHTGVFEAGVKAAETVDNVTGQVVNETIRQGGTVLITADHGNCEQMIDPASGEIDKEHTTNPVPFMVVSPANQRTPKKPEEVEPILLSPTGVLADVSPTILEIMGIAKPDEMTGRSLLGSLS